MATYTDRVEKSVTHYEPGPLPSDPESLGIYTVDELKRLGNVLFNQAAFRLERINAVPDKPRAGDIRYFDGTNADPLGTGVEGLYVFKKGSHWVNLLALDAGTVEISGASGDLTLEMDNNVANSANLKIRCDAGSPRADFYVDDQVHITLNGQRVGILDTSPSYTLDVFGDGRFVSNLIAGGSLTVGDGGAEDTYLNFDGNAQDFRIGIDDGTDKLEIGAGTAHGTTAAIAIDSSADMTLGGSIACADEVISRPRFTDYSETVSAIGTETSAFNIDLEDGNVQTLTMSGGGTFNIGITNALSSHSNSVTILGTNLGSCTASFKAGAHDGGGNAVYWSDGDDTSDNLMTASGTDVVTLTTFDGGTNFYGFVAGKGMTNS